MKRKNLLAVLSATALMTLGMALTSFAANGWVKDGTNWRYYDNDGYEVTDEFRKSGDYFFYLDHEGKMAVDSVVDHDGHFYYVDVDGVRIANRWVKADVDGDVDWFYFENTGKAKADGWATINGHRYHFTDSRMDYGWYVDGEREYYLGTEDEGWATTGWKYVMETDDEDVTKEEGWYFFDQNGKMVKNCEKKIDGQYYSFDENGLMLDNWVSFGTASNASDSEVYKYYMDSVGNRADGWRYLEELEDEDGNIVSDEGWYYFKSGRAYTADYRTTQIDDNLGIAKINNRYYGFDADGKMYYGLIQDDNGRYFYFGDESDGAMKTGRVKIEINDGDYDIDEDYMYFNTKGAVGTRGSSYTGYTGGYAYDNGIAQKAEMDRYELVTLSDGKSYVVNESGRVKTSGTVTLDDDTKMVITKAKDGSGYTWTEKVSK